MNGKILSIKLNALYFILFGTIACYYPFLTVYFQGKGLSYSQIGVLYAVNSLVAVVCQPIWGIITDKYFNKRYIMLLTMTISAVLVLLFTFVKGFELVLMSVILFMMFQSPISSINDAYCYEIIDMNKELQYGRIRLMGSIGYAIVALSLGVIVKLTTTNSTFIAYVILMAASILILKSINFKGRKMNGAFSISDISDVLKNKRFVLMLLSAMTANAALGANGNYLAVLIQKTGGDVSNLGMLWFIVAMSELPVFFFGNRILRKVGVVNVYLLSMIFYSLRFFIDSIGTYYGIVLVIQILQGITFTLYLLSTLQYINETVPAKMRTSAITVFTAITSGIGGFTGNIGGGFILENFNVFFLYRILSGVCILALIIGFILKKYEKDSLQVVK